MNTIKVEREFQGRELTLETGRLARQAGGAVFASWGGTQVLATATMGTQKTDRDFFPLSVDYIEKFYANGKIPGSYMKREAKPSNEEIHIARLIDRPLRPLFSNEIRNEIQVIITVLSLDKETTSDILAMIAASAAIMISDIPFEKAVGAVRVGYINEELVINPKQDQLASLDLDLIVAGTDSAITMIEGGGNEISEDKVLFAVKEAHEVIKTLVDFQLELVAKTQKGKREVELFSWSDELKKILEEKYFSRLQEILSIPSKIERENKKAILYKEINENFSQEEELPSEQVPRLLYKMESSIVRDMILNKSQRPDGRELTALRDLHCEINTLAKPHGSAVFTRGETQALGVITVGSEKDRQKVDLTRETLSKDFLLHYNFPPFSVGEVSRLVSIGRREIGHGILAERSLQFTLPEKEDYDFTIRLVSEILESNGSSSMATVCAGSLALMAAGVPIKKHVAGIAMGLILENDNYKILTDIQGMEDALGDMDFKVAGTREGITGFQLDIKIEGITLEIMEKALAQAKDARLKILAEMEACIATPQKAKDNVPLRKITSIPKDKIRNLIGPGGKNIKQIVEETGSDIDISDDGKVKIFAPNQEILDATEVLVKRFSGSVDVGEEFSGTVRGVKDFGAFIEILPGVEGLCHISKLSDKRITDIYNYIKEGDLVDVRVEKVDERGKISLVRI